VPSYLEHLIDYYSFLILLTTDYWLGDSSPDGRFLIFAADLLNDWVGDGEH
jgi:hypothetical protein